MHDPSRCRHKQFDTYRNALAVTIMRRNASVLVVVLACAGVLPATAVAQESAGAFPESSARVDPGGSASRVAASPDSASRFFSAVGNDFRHLASVENMLTIATAGGLALAVHPVDDNLTNGARGTEPLEEAFDAGAALGDGWIQVGTAVGTYAIGRLTEHHQVQAVGGDLVRAQLMSGVLTQALKMAFDRTRPDGSSHSFPSGHASAAFATATVLQRHFGWRVGLPIFGAASYVAASRLSENKHYASDVIFGAALGIVAGRSVTVGRGGHAFAVSPVAMHGGAAVLFTRIARG
jgi:membrane-associated phospholipid phosphatase